jgi:hypothetical protein
VPVVQADVNPLDPTAELEDLEAFYLQDPAAEDERAGALPGGGW